MILNNKQLIKSPSQIKNIKFASQVLCKLKDKLKNMIRKNVNLLELDKFAKNFIIKNKCKPSFLNYKKYPNTICIGLNDLLIHGIPWDYKLKNGDLLTIDVGCSYNNYHSDTAFSLVVGNKCTAKQKKILNITNQTLKLAIKCCKDGVNLKNIAKIIYNNIIKNNFDTPIYYGGHGIGKKLHEFPFVANHPLSSIDFNLVEGMVIAIEPMIMTNDNKLKIKNKWNIYSVNGLDNCHAEETILITKDGCEILTSNNNE